MNAVVLMGISLSLLSEWTNYSIERKPVDLDAGIFPSPDRSKVVSFSYGSDGWYHLKVKDVATGRVDDSAEVELTPIFSVQWTRDSKSILTVAHIAHGSAVTFFHLQDGKWKTQDIASPSIPGADGSDVYRVVEEVAKTEATEHEFVVHYEFGIETRTKDGDFQEVVYDEVDRVDPRASHAVLLKRTRRQD